MRPAGGFTDTVRQELASLEITDLASASAELAAIAALRGSVVVARTSDGRIAGDAGQLEITTVSGAVARRTHGLISRVLGWAPQLAVRTDSGMSRRTTYGIRCTLTAPLRTLLGLDESLLGRGVEDGATGQDHAIHVGERTAWLRGAMLSAVWLSAPGRPPHLEVRVERPAVTAVLCAHLEEVIGVRAVVIAGEHAREDRVVLKSGEAIGDLLVAVGASSAFLAWDERRLRRQLRSDANRLANADTANVRRSVRAADRQVRRIEAVVQRWGWEVLDEPDRQVALARIANPTASLAELGRLLDPPVSKATVARRLDRIMSWIDERPSGPR